ncbi:DNA topoisomerase I [Chlorella sorokiniana]|uniref:DNA topoisomerase n=1 Tax=Chlorella sorokiniana TaxID=3076 RepID=A0A2P6TSI9_CHLSO|nr:DNA topoisomerase I [Chlorella sorokiniana]|eukprot:PRW57014.1 DNA topoisomerase I [Chlorella sorokiniana]
MLARTLRHRSLSWLQLAAPAAGRATALGSSSLFSSASSAVRSQNRGLLAAAARRSSSSSTSAASEAAAKEAAAKTAATEAAEAAADTAAPRQGRKRAAAATPAAVRRGTVVLVESPAKAKKIQGFLGPEYKVLASYGHVRDLPSKPGAVVPNEGFEMAWELTKPAQPRMEAIVAAVKGAERLVLATDPDREGEAISWHLLQELQARKAVNGNVPVERITFTEVTQGAIKDALANPRQISEPLVEAYMARRALDYLFGFHLSPMLWRKVPGARSAGRVQSVALRLVCERENEVEAFVRQKYWSVEADLLMPQGSHLEARITEVDGAPPPLPGFLDDKEAAAIAKRVGTARFEVEATSSREQQRQPPAPFTTSTLQQEANNRMGLSTGRTMSLAQQLYEAGHITYMRTDGVSMAPTALTELRANIQKEFGSACLPAKPREYKARSKNAQEAHEAIRPTDSSVTAQQLAQMGVELQAARLYGLIRSRALASQMTPAKLRLVAVDLAAQDATGQLRMRSNASCVASPGFLSAYFDPAVITGEEGSAARLAAGEAEEEALALLVEDEGFGSSALQRRAQQEAERVAAAAALAALKKGDRLTVVTAAALEHETRPPPRYTEGSLVKALEEAGIGRPSTYAPTLHLLQQRGYVRKEGRALHAQALGRVLTAFLQAYFSPYVDYRFTSGLEEQLDQVSGGEKAWKEVLSGFWDPFTQQLGEMGGVPVKDVIEKLNEAVGDQLIGKDRTCPSCRSPLSLKFSSKFRGAPFVGCSTYPDCDYSRPISGPWVLDAEEGAPLPGAGSAGSEGEEGEDSEGQRLVKEHNFKGHARHLGQCPQTGLHVFLRTGLYGPYVQRGKDDDPLFHRQALPRNINTRQVALETALAMLSLPKDLGKNPATGESVLVTMGKFGPFLRCGAASRAIPKGYDPLDLTLADALQVLASKQRWSTSKKERKAAAAAAAVSEAVSAAVAAAEEHSAAKRKEARGRPKKKEPVNTEKMTAKAKAAAAVLAPVPEEDSRHEAAIADVEARLALDAAANVEIDQLKDALKYTDKEAEEAERMAAAVSKLHRFRGQTGFNIFVTAKSRQRREAGAALDGQQGPATKHVSAMWQALSEEEKEPYNREANRQKMDAALHIVGLLQEGQVLWELPEQEQLRLEDEFGQRRREYELRQMVLNNGVVLPRPRNAYNLFTVDVVARKRALTGSGESLIQVSEMWRTVAASERLKYKQLATEEQKEYHAARERMTREQQKATAAALEKGASSLEAARAGIMAAAAVSQEYRRERQEARRQQGVLVPESDDEEVPKRRRVGRPKKAAAAADHGSSGAAPP